MEQTYNLNELAIMTGFTTRTLRNYLNQGLLPVFDFLADTAKQANRACVILDLPVSDEEGAAVSDFFCKKMMHASSAAFTYHRDRGMSRVILTGAEDQVAEILRDYYKG